MAYGYTGKIVRINLTTGGVTLLSTWDYVPKYIGGRGICNKIFWDEVGPGIKALDSIVLGFGCVTMSVLASRILENNGQGSFAVDAYDLECPVVRTVNLGKYPVSSSIPKTRKKTVTIGKTMEIEYFSPILIRP